MADAKNKSADNANSPSPLAMLDIDSAFAEVEKEIDAGNVEVTKDASNGRSTKDSVVIKKKAASKAPEDDDEDDDQDSGVEDLDDDDSSEDDDDDSDAEDSVDGGDDDEPKKSKKSSDRNYKFSTDENAILSAAQVDADTISRLSTMRPEDRQIHVNMLRQQLQRRQADGKDDKGGNANGSPFDTALLDKHMPIDDEMVNTFAESLNVEGKKLKGVLQSVRNSTARPLIEAIGQVKQLVENIQAQQSGTIYGVVAKMVRGPLQRKYEQLRDDKEFKSLVSSKGVLSLVKSKMADGMDIADAADEAIRERADSKYGRSLSSKDAARRASARTVSLRGTTDTGRSSRKPADTDRKPANTEEALDMAFDAMKDAGKL